MRETDFPRGEVSGGFEEDDTKKSMERIPNRYIEDRLECRMIAMREM